MSIADKKGISVTSGFKLISGQPLDARVVVDDLTGLQDLVNNGAAYEGIVVYVKSEQQLKQYNGSEWDNVYPESDIITVNSLPNIENAKLDKIYRVPKLLASGTTIPNTGTVGNIHFNKTLSIKQVEDILNELTFSGEAYLVLAASDESPIIVVYKHTEPEGMVIRSENGRGVLWANEGAVQNYASTYGITHAGWQSFANPIVLNEEVKATSGGASVGIQNPLLTQLIFTDPFSEIIIGFTYHRVEGNKWIEILNGGSSGSSSDFVDVEELPVATIGTEVPSSGFIDKVYINTSLSNDEIIDIMSSVDLVQVPGFSGDLYAVATTADFSNALSITKDTDDDDRYIVQMVNGENNLLWSSRNGWVVNDTIVNCGYNNMLSVVAPQLGGTVQNDKLKKLISTTPFELNPEIDLSKIYRVPEYDWVGTEVPSSGTIEKVYINTSLSDEEIISICESLDMVEIQGFPQCPILTNANMSAHLTLLYDENTTFGFVLNGNIGGTSVDYWRSAQGWVNSQSEITVGFQTYLGVLAPQVGATVQNDKITKFISSTPFTRTGDLLGYKYYRVIDSIWVEVMGGGINEEEVNTIIAKYMTSNYGNGDTEEF